MKIAINSRKSLATEDYSVSLHANCRLWFTSHFVEAIRFAKQVHHMKPVTTINEPRPGLLSWCAALRVTQWAKNLLIFLPLLPVAKTVSVSMFKHAVETFVVFASRRSRPIF